MTQFLKTTVINMCTYIITRGKNKNKLCGKKNCNKHRIIQKKNFDCESQNNTCGSEFLKPENDKDSYTQELLNEQYMLHKQYVNGRIDTTKKTGVKVRLPSIPEDISENIIKFIIRNKLHDNTTRWDCKKGDLHSQIEGKQECKCFTSDGPSSFTPSSDWDVIYFLDARNWLIYDKFILYRIPLKRTSNEWKNIKVNKTQTFEDQTKQGRRPRISWEFLQPQISLYCNKVYEGSFEDIFSLSH